MNKNDFLVYLEQGLIDRGIDPSLASKHVLHFGKTISQEDEDEINSIDNPGDLDEMIEGMAEFLRRRIQQKKKTPSNISQDANEDYQTRGSSEHDSPTIEISPILISDKSIKAVAPDMGEDTAVVDVDRGANASSVPKIKKTDRGGNFPQEKNNQALNAVDRTEKAGDRRDAGTPPPKIEFDFGSIEYEMPEATAKGKAIFWATFAVTLPFTAFIFAALSAVFFGLIIGFSVTIAGIIAGLVAMVAAGSAVSLVGVIYGITQLFVLVPIGLYEIGLGIIITGFMMLAGILLYNFAIRLLPFVIRKIYEFFKLYLRSVKYLFIYLKGRCYTL